MNHLLNLLLVMALSAGVGCRPKSEAARSSGKGEPSASQGPPTASSALDPCALALAPHSGNAKVDQEIIRVQQQVPGAVKPDSLLEQLGWLFVEKARISFDPGYYKLAEQCAACLDLKRPGSLEAKLLRGHVLQNLHRFKDAQPLARELAAKRGLPFDFGLLGDVLMEQGRLNEAIDAYQKMADLRPDPQAYTRIAHIRWLRGDLEGAIEAIRPAARSTNPRDAESGAWTLSRLALYEWQAGNSAQARRSCEAALELQNDYPLALLVQGRMLSAEGKNAEAVEPLLRATAVNPLPEFRWVLAEAMRAAGMDTGADEMETRLKRSGAVEDPRTFALYLATRGEQPLLAVQLAERELRERADVHSHDALAWALAANGRWEEASQETTQALAEGTPDARLLLHAGVIATKLRRANNAHWYLGEAERFQQMLLPSERQLFQQTQHELAGLTNSGPVPSRAASARNPDDPAK
jgi:tetratricopeptide (TPR) repeat protein